MKDRIKNKITSIFKFFPEEEDRIEQVSKVVAGEIRDYIETQVPDVEDND